MTGLKPYREINRALERFEDEEFELAVRRDGQLAKWGSAGILILAALFMLVYLFQSPTATQEPGPMDMPKAESVTGQDDGVRVNVDPAPLSAANTEEVSKDHRRGWRRVLVWTLVGLQVVPYFGFLVQGKNPAWYMDELVTAIDLLFEGDLKWAAAVFVGVLIQFVIFNIFGLIAWIVYTRSKK